MSSTSDDRSVVIWNVETQTEHQNTHDHWKYAKITPVYSLYAHKARVWKSIIMRSGNILSAGEVIIICLLIDFKIKHSQIQHLGWSNMFKNAFYNLPMGRKQRFSSALFRLYGA